MSYSLQNLIIYKETGGLLINKQVGNRIKQIRQSLGLSQEACALKAQIDRTYWTDVENGKRNVSIINLQKIINALDLNFEKFFKGM